MRRFLFSSLALSVCAFRNYVHAVYAYRGNLVPLVFMLSAQALADSDGHPSPSAKVEDDLNIAHRGADVLRGCDAAVDKSHNSLCTYRDERFGILFKHWLIGAGLLMMALAGYLFYRDWAVHHINGFALAMVGEFVFMMGFRGLNCSK
jgi:hypothetical protein